MEGKVIDNINELKDERPMSKILKDSIQEIRITKNSLWQYITAFAIGCSGAFFFAICGNTVSVTSNIFDKVLSIDLAFLAMILGAYSIFQALMRDEIVKELINTDNNILKESNRTFLNLSIMYVINIVVCTVVLGATYVLSPEFIVGNVMISNILYVLIIAPILVVSILLWLENINFVINLYRMFNVYNIYRSIDILTKQIHEDEKE